MITTYRALPSSLRIYGASDYATMEITAGKKEPDFTEHGIFGMDSRGELWAMDWFFRQCETDEGIRHFIRLVSTYKPIRWWNEGGVIDKAISPAIRDAMRRKQTFTAMEMLTSIEDKSMKLQGFHARYTAKTIHWPIRKKWVDHVIDQLVKFPAGKHDDAADVCGLIGRGVDKMYSANLPYVPKKEILVPFTEAWLEHGYNDQKPKVRYFT
jgi:predicted phage terminase large subunit-like protein